MSTFSAGYELTPRRPMLARTVPDQSISPVVRDWTTINRDISAKRPVPPTLPRREEALDEDPERWDGLG